MALVADPALAPQAHTGHRVGTQPARPWEDLRLVSEIPAQSPKGWLPLALGALGVVFGDIGTSPLYALQTVFSIDHNMVKTTPGDVYGVISLVFWSITLVVSVKYVAFILRADNDGEGGVMALAALARTAVRPGGRRFGLVMLLGVLGASLFYGDSVITPAISVMSAIEGLSVTTPELEHLVVPIGAAIIAVLFGVQRFGTHLVGRFFGPVMVLWFAVLAALGGAQVVRAPAILRGSRRITRSCSRWSTQSSRSSPWARSSSSSPEPKRSTPTWATSDAAQSGARGSWWCSLP